MLTKRNLVINTIIKINNFLGVLKKYLGLSKGLNVVSVYGGGLEAKPSTLLCNSLKRWGSSDFFCYGSLKPKKRALTRSLHTRKAAFTPGVRVSLQVQQGEKKNLHSSLDTIFKDKSRGGLLLRKVIYHISDQNSLALPLFLTAKGIKASHTLIDMLNLLPLDCDSKFKGDNLLFQFLSENYNQIHRYNMELSLKEIKPIVVYCLPIGKQKVIDGDCSGIYCFKHLDFAYCSIGSALSCRNRLNEHMASLNGHRGQTFFHKWVSHNGGIPPIRWAPIITFNNIVQEWYNLNYDSPLSVGGANILQGFAQYSIRLLEQCVYTNYRPYLNGKSEKSKDIIFFNFSFKASDMRLSLANIHKYQAWFDKDMTMLLAESSSYNYLANILKISVGTVRNNMNWDKGVSVTDDDASHSEGKITTVYLKEKGTPFRTDKISSQLPVKKLYPLVELKNRTLHDLIPGKIHVICVNTLEDFSRFTSQRELWKALNPSSLKDYDNLTATKQHRFNDNRVGKYFNVAKPGGISTELGNFYFCKHPDYLPGLAKTASGFFAVNTLTGVATYYLNNSTGTAGPRPQNRGTVRSNRVNNTVTKTGFRYIDKDVFIKHYPDAVAEKHTTYNLSPEQLNSLPYNP